MMTVSPSLNVQSLPALSVRTNSFLSAWIPLTLPAAMASPATAGPARRTKAASALNHFEKLFMLPLPSSNLMARSPLTLKGRAFIRSTWDRTCFNSGGGRHQLGADRQARTSVDGVTPDPPRCQRVLTGDFRHPSGDSTSSPLCNWNQVYRQS